MSTVRCPSVSTITKYVGLTYTLIICLSMVQTAVLPDGGTTTNIQGPSSQTKIMGPDGSVIMAEAPGGQIVHQERTGVFEPAGRALGPVSPLLSPAVPGEVAHKAVDTALMAPTGTLAAGSYVAQTAQDGTQTVVGGLGTTSG